MQSAGLIDLVRGWLCSREQLERTINTAANTITNTTGEAEATGYWTGRTGITDHLA